MNKRRIVLLVILLLLITPFIGLIDIPTAQAATPSTTFYSTASDGDIDFAALTFNDAWTAATGNDPYDEDVECIIVLNEHQAGTYELARSGFFFDTSSLPEGITILSATLSFYSFSLYADSGHYDIVVQNGQPTYPHDPLVVGDYDKSHYSGDGGSINTAVWDDNGWNDITLNADGRSWINTEGTTKFLMRSSTDIAGTEAPADDYNYAEVYTNEKGEGFIPKLVVEYAETSWWDHDWQFRARIDITGSTIGDLTNYPVQFNLLAGSGICNGNDIYTNGTAQVDYDDIRFVDADQVTLLNYWLTDNYTWVYPDATVWVNVTNIPASPSAATIWAYWANDEASSLSDGSAVFPFFDDFLTDPAGNSDWTVVEGGGGTTDVHFYDWYISVEGESASDGWSYLKGTKNLILSGGSSVYGWSMEWDNGIASNAGNENFNYYGAGLANNLDHQALAFDELYSGVSWYWHSINPFSSRAFWYDEWNSTGDVVQFNHAAYAWPYDLNEWVEPDHWSRYQMTLFNDSSQVFQNTTQLREFTSLDSSYLGLGLDPSFSAHGKAGDANTIYGYVNWVFMRPLADPEPTPAAGRSESVVVALGIHNMEGCGNWVFEGRTKYIFYINVSSVGDVGSEIDAGIGFYDFDDDGGYFYSFYYDNETGRITVVSPEDGISPSLLNVSVGDEWLYINFTVIFNTPIDDSHDVNLYARWDIPDIGDSGWYLAAANYFNIYNKGGYSTLTTSGTAGRRIGGDTFEIYAGGTDGSARVNQTWRNLQHMHFLVSIQQEDPCHSGLTEGAWDDRTWFVEYGIDFCYNDVWYEGIKVRIEMLAGRPSPWGTPVVAVAWVYTKWNVTWFYADEKIRSDEVYGYWEGYWSSKDWTRMWIDLWFSRDNASTTVGGRMNSELFGMKKGGLFWWTEWNPHTTNVTQSMFSHDLEAGGNIISSKEITMMIFWANVTKADLGEGTCLHTIQLRDYDLLNRETASQVMEGVPTPVLIKTKEPDMSQTGFLASLVATMKWGFDRLSEGIWMGAMAGFTYFIEFADTITGYFGLPGFISTLLSMVDSGWGFFTTLMSEGYMFSMVGNIFTVVTGFFGHFIWWITRIISSFLSIFTIAWSIIDGTYTGLGPLVDLWATFEWNKWVGAMPIFIILAWLDSIDQRAKKSGGGWMGFFFSDLQMVWWVTMALLEVADKVINWTIRIVEMIINILPIPGT